MADEDDGYAARLGTAQQGRGTLAHLRYAACRRLYVLGRYGLDGVDDHQFGLFDFDMVEDMFEGVFAEDQEIIRPLPDPFP